MRSKVKLFISKISIDLNLGFEELEDLDALKQNYFYFSFFARREEGNKYTQNLESIFIYAFRYRYLSKISEFI